MIDLEVLKTVTKVYPAIHAVDTQVGANIYLLKTSLDGISDIQVTKSFLDDQVDIYIDFSRNGQKLCAMWHYRLDGNPTDSMKTLTGLSVHELYRKHEWEPVYTDNGTDEELIELVHRYSDLPADPDGTI